MSVSAPAMPASLVAGRKFVKARAIERPPQHGEKPYVKLVDDAFDGATLRWSKRLRLLEEADTRKIRRGDALDLIEAMQRQRAKKLKVPVPSKVRSFVIRYAAFAAAYIALAMAWCAVASLAH
jgi:hypothetical protein